MLTDDDIKDHIVQLCVRLIRQAHPQCNDENIFTEDKYKAWFKKILAEKPVYLGILTDSMEKVRCTLLKSLKT